ncbi:hypothetical protein [Nonomuraea sp. NPDC005501]
MAVPGSAFNALFWLGAGVAALGVAVAPYAVRARPAAASLAFSAG